MENKNEAVIANYIEKMMGERRQKIFESDEYIQQANGDLDYLEERYSSLKIPYAVSYTHLDVYKRQLIILLYISSVNGFFSFIIVIFIPLQQFFFYIKCMCFCNASSISSD